MNASTRSMDMLHGPLSGKLLLFTLPIALSGIIQQLFNAADTSIVGYFDNAAALAAVGTNGEIVALIVTLSAGLSLGVNILVAGCIGRGRTQDVPAAAGTAVLLAAVLGCAGLAAGQWAAKPLLRLIRTPQSIFPAAESYLRIYLLGYPFLLIYDFSAAVLLCLRREYAVRMLRLGVPSAVQGAVFCLANIFVQAAVNGFGEDAIAGSIVAMNFEYRFYYVITAFGQTATTFTSQNHAAGMPDRCARVFRLCLLYSVLFSAVLIAPVVAFRRFFCSLFSTEPAVMQYACLRIMCILLYEPACCLYEIPAGCLRGAGHAVLPAAATLLGTCAFRIVWTCAVFPRQPSLALLILLPTGPQYMAATSVGLFFTGLLSGIHIGCTIVGVFVLFYGLSLFLRGRS